MIKISKCCIIIFFIMLIGLVVIEYFFESLFSGESELISMCYTGYILIMFVFLVASLMLQIIEKS
ncbi:MAG: hypothetical protein GTN40_03465 [Candidatus Aenigmarchaeota archaeon]|nr:hypothetical protein [Candidatus Aenigmarchaeota archaeon]